MGNENCPGDTHNFALGHLNNASLTNTLCSNAYDGTTICFTVPVVEQDSTSSKYSCVGANGACSHNPPSSSSFCNLTTTQRKGVCSGPNCKFCSIDHIFVPTCVLMERFGIVDEP